MIYGYQINVFCAIIIFLDNLVFIVTINIHEARHTYIVFHLKK